ncbi:MAG: cupin domain-containing protein [Halobacteriaceae archaeon]
MERVRLDDQDNRMGPATVSTPLTDILGLTDAAVNYYELASGDSFAFGFHAHEEQEEVFYIQEGTVTFRTVGGSVEVGPREVVRFGPGEYQRGVNEGDTRVVALAIGAPQDAGATEILRACPSCETETAQSLELTDDKDAIVARCEECETVTGEFT